MVNKYSNKNKSKSLKSKNKKSKSLKSKRVTKIIQGGGYYEPNDFTQENNTNQSGGVIFTGNTLLIIIIILIFIIGILAYFYLNSINNTNTNINIDDTINTELLKESEILKTHKFNSSNSSNSSNKNKESFNNINHLPYSKSHRLVSHDADNINNIPIIPHIINHNVERIINPLLPPERSYVNTYGIPTNIPTRGFSGGFQQVGSLHKTEIANDTSEPGNNNKSVILPLFGQPTYQGSNKWNYYTTTEKSTMVKLTFKIGNRNSDDRHGVDELMTGDDVQIPEYNGNFKVKVYQFDQPKYIPFIY